MLQTIHDKITGWVAGIVIGAISLTFIFWGIDVGFGSVSYAAKVKGHDQWPWQRAARVTIDEVNRAYQNQLNRYQQMMRSEVPEEIRKELQQRLMDQFVQDELLEQHATKLGYRVREDDIDRSIQQEPAFQIDGKFSEDVATRFLETQGYSPRAFREEQRRGLQIAQVRAVIAASSFVTPAEIERARALETEEREVAWAVINPATLLAGITPDDAAITRYYEENKKNLMTPETVTLNYVELKVADMAPQVAVTEEALRGYYENVKDRYVEAERRHGRHILIKVDETTTEEAARKKADELLAKAKAPGADFAALAKEFSQDAGSAEQGGDLGWAERSFFVGPFSDALFAMQPNEIRGPVRTEFGYHILRLEGIQAGKQKSFEEVRAELENEFRTQEAEKLFSERQEQLAEKAFENPDSLDAAAKVAGVTVQSVPEFKRTGGAGAFGDNEEVITAAFSNTVLEEGQNSEPIELEPGHVLVLRVDDRKQPQQRPLADVRDEIVALIKKQRADEQARTRGTEAVAKLTSGANWASVVADLKVEGHGPEYVKRTDATIPNGLRQALFLAPKPAAGKPHYQGVPLPSGEYGVIAFTAARVSTTPETPEQRQARARQLAGRVAQSEVVGYVEELRRKADIDTNPKTFE
jgi:peptidyl-prolyl cis-trans isomerase D